MTERERVLDMLARVHSGDPWHGPSVMASLDGIDAVRASARPLPETHSIWEIAQHVIAWRREVAARLRGKPPSTPASGDWPAPGTGGPAWAETKAALDASHRELMAVVADLDDGEMRAHLEAQRSRQRATRDHEQHDRQRAELAVCNPVRAAPQQHGCHHHDG